VKSEATTVSTQPIACDFAPTPTPGDSPGAKWADGAAILVADDNEVNRFVTEEILRSAGFACTLACNGREAVDAAATGRFELILMDCQMPVMDGFSAVAELRQREGMGELFTPTGPMPIVALTANAVRGDREKCLAAGMNGYVTKPIDRNALLAEIGRFIQPKNANSSNDIESSCLAPLAPERGEGSGVRGSAPRFNTDDLRLNELLDRCQGDRDFSGRVLQKFRNRLPEHLRELRTAADAGDGGRIKQIAHQLKGSAGNIGAVVLQRQAAAMEAEVSERAAIEKIDVAQIERDAEACLDAIDALLAEYERT
jgi:CheY-like chemotaxis protein/HPt (histidine-containing phosphotransfer) domain-containing protein